MYVCMYVYYVYYVLLCVCIETTFTPPPALADGTYPYPRHCLPSSNFPDDDEEDDDEKEGASETIFNATKIAD